MPNKRLEFIRAIFIYVARTYKWMIPYLKGLHLKINGCRERHEKYLYKTKIQPRVCMKVWDWEHENWLEEN